MWNGPKDAIPAVPRDDASDRIGNADRQAVHVRRETLDDDAIPGDIANVAIKGGHELRRSLYAFAVKTLIGPGIKADAALLYRRADDDDEEPLCSLADVDWALTLLAAVRLRLALGRVNGGGPFSKTLEFQTGVVERHQRDRR